MRTKDLAVRQQILVFLSRTKYGKENMSPERLRKVAAQLGVTPELLMEARIVRKERAAAFGLTVGTLRDYHNRRTANKSGGTYLTVHTYKEIKALLTEEAHRRQVTCPMLLRATVNSYLLGSWEPPIIYETWRGMPGSLEQKTRDCVINIGLSMAAYTALEMRAEVHRTAIAPLVRSILIYMMRGEFAAHHDLKYVTVRQMHQTVREFCVRFPEDPVQVPEELDYYEAPR